MPFPPPHLLVASGLWRLTLVLTGTIYLDQKALTSSFEVRRNLNYLE